jgi:hypothetical protein
MLVGYLNENFATAGFSERYLYRSLLSERSTIQLWRVDLEHLIGVTACDRIPRDSESECIEIRSLKWIFVMA